jgi:selenocysteine-specific elongation factor
MPLIMGSAGHIDHGKTSLVRAITGIDCDRLEEEKRRGITIELGFAHYDLPDGGRLGIIDVPGHERFVKNMVAGAAGIDFVMLVIAADEGVMPQTREHLEICSLLGIRRGFVALTKTDLVDDEWLKLVEEDVAGFLKGGFLENAPILPVSSVTGRGLDELKALIHLTARDAPGRRGADLFRLPVDRIFTMKGHGTVVTGTLVSGSIRVGEEVALEPSGLNSRVRALQSHGNVSEAGSAGTRVAVNLQNLEVGEVERGETLARPGTLFPSARPLVRLHCLSSSPRALRQRTEVHFHHGTRELSARLHFFDRDRLAPGESALAELRLNAPAAGVFADRCVLRAFSPLRTVAGGIVLHPPGMSLRKRDPRFAERLALLAELSGLAVNPEGREERLLHIQILLAGDAGVDRPRLAVLTGLDDRSLDAALRELASKGAIACFDKEARAYAASSVLEDLSRACLAQAGAFHRKDPLKAGMARGVLSAGFPGGVSPRLAHFVTERCIRAGSLVPEGELLRLPEHRVSLASDQAGLRSKILETYRGAGMSPPNLKEALEALKADSRQASGVIRLLVDEGSLVKVTESIYYAGEVMEEIRRRVLEWFAGHEEIDHTVLRELTGGLSRKYLIALLEYFDRERLTIRVGDARRPRRK